MSEEIMDQVEESVVTSEPQLYAGKFKSVEDLEKGYKESLSVHLKNKELQGALDEFKSIPESYETPEGVRLRDGQLNEIKELAKRAGLNQNQYKEAVRKYDEDISSKLNAMDERKKSVGEEKISLVKGYVEKRFSEFDDSFRSEVLNRFIKDDSMLEKVMEDRNKDLNSSAPGVNQVSTNAVRTSDMRNECQQAALKCKLDPRDKTARNKYINLCREVAHARKES